MMNISRFKCRWILPLLLVFQQHFSHAQESGVQLLLATGGKALYQIVAEENAGEEDQLALRELCFFLKECSGADFEWISAASDKAAASTRRIFIGLSPLAKQLLSEQDIVLFTEKNQVVIEVAGSDLFLFGDGLHGNLHAVYEFLEQRLGILWLSAYGDMRIPEFQDLRISAEKSRVTYAFSMRSLMNWFYTDKQQVSLFQGRNRQNILLIENQPGIRNQARTLHPAHHSLAYYIPGFQGNNMGKPLEWLADKNYFASNPEFFSMDEKGERVINRQLCFSNTELRKELSKNVMEQYRRETAKRGYDGIVTIECNDIAYAICCCPDCQKQQKTYQAEGGPLFDFLIEIAKENPDITFRTLAYQRGQTQRAPVLEGKLPDNIMITFAPINGNFAAGLQESKVNQRDLDDLQQWSRICQQIWVWYYPNPYRSGNFFIPPPVGNLRRLAADIRLMHSLGIQGTYFEHDSGGIQSGSNFSELQSWVMLRLFQNPEQDLVELIETFTNAYYGAAAPLMRKILDELESEREDFVKRGGVWNWNTLDYHYLDESHFLRWSNDYDQAETLVQNEEAFRVRLNRLGLDTAMLAKMSYKNYAPELFEALRKRTEETLMALSAKRQVNLLEKFGRWIAERREEIEMLPLSLPEHLTDLDPARLQIVLPDFSRLAGESVVRDREAAVKKAVFEVVDGDNYHMLTYDYILKQYGASRLIKKEEIQPNRYHFYLLSKGMKLSPDLVFHGAKWQISVPLKGFSSADDLASLEQLWEVYVSLKFSGPAYDEASQETENRVYCDRLLLIRRP